jgi:hypothetical protein
MADEQKKTEPGFFKKMYASLQRAQVTLVGDIGGEEAAHLTAAAIKAGNEGKYIEGAKLGFHADAEIEGHLLDVAKGAATKLNNLGKNNGAAIGGSIGGVVGAAVGYEVQHAIHGGQDVKEHGGVPSLPAKLATKDQGHNP